MVIQKIREIKKIFFEYLSNCKIFFYIRKEVKNKHNYNIVKISYWEDNHYKDVPDFVDKRISIMVVILSFWLKDKKGSLKKTVF